MGWLPSARAMQSRCCCPPERLVAGASSRSLTSSQSAAWRRHCSTSSGRSRGGHEAVEARAVGHVVVDRLGERIGTLEHHPDLEPELDQVGPAEDGLPVEQEVAAVDRAFGSRSCIRLSGPQEGRLAAARRADDGRRGLAGHLEGDPVQDLALTVGKPEVRGPRWPAARIGGRGGPDRGRSVARVGRSMGVAGASGGVMVAVVIRISP